MSFLSDLFSFRRGQPEAEPAPAPATDEPAPPGAEVLPAPEALLPEAAAAPVAPIELAPAPAVAAAPPAPSAAERAQAEVLVHAVRQELPDFITIAVVEISSGRILAGQWAGHSGGAVEAAAANAAIVHQVQLAIGALELAPAEQLHDIVVTLRRQQHLLQVLPQSQWLLYLAVPSPGTNLALARTVLRGFAT